MRLLHKTQNLNKALERKYGLENVIVGMKYNN